MNDVARSRLGDDGFIFHDKGDGRFKIIAFIGFSLMAAFVGTNAGGSRCISHMPEKAVYLLVVEGFADWEPAHAVAELRRHGRYRIETIGLTEGPVESMGGIRILPSKNVREIEANDVAALILPGGDRWERAPIEPEIEELVRRLDAQDVPIAAICGATVAIAKIGILRDRRHTSNGLDYLRSHVTGYAEEANYVDEPAVRDRGLITASGLGDVEFARELFEQLGVMSSSNRVLWAQIFRSARVPGSAR